MSQSRQHVVIGLVFNQQKKVLVAKRNRDFYQDWWEFPGGKCEADELAYQALVRELDEELAIDVQQARSILQQQYDYPDRLLLLDFWLVEDYSGQPKSAEGQSLKWSSFEQLDQLQFLESSLKLIPRLQALI